MSQAVAPDALLEKERMNSFPTVRDGVDMAALVGTPHLFGKLKLLRRGHLVQPIGVLTLQPDGRLTGYAHPNEGSWTPYAHGEVDADKAFAF